MPRLISQLNIMTQHIDIVFKKKEQPINEPPEYTFVEIEDDKGQSISLGEWLKTEDYNIIRITKSDFEKLFNQDAREYRNGLISDIEKLYPPDTHDELGWSVMMNAFMRTWRYMPTYFLEALKTECINEERKKYGA